MSNDVRNCPNCDVEWDGAPDAPAKCRVYFCSLHAAAPKLLETLKLCERHLANLGLSMLGVDRELLKSVRAAIADAEKKENT